MPRRQAGRQKFNPTNQGIVANAYKPSTLEAEAGKSRVQGQPPLHETLSQKHKKAKTKR